MSFQKVMCLSDVCALSMNMTMETPWAWKAVSLGSGRIYVVLGSDGHVKRGRTHEGGVFIVLRDRWAAS